MVLGLLIAGYFVHLGPSVSMRPLPLTWSRAALDAGELEVQFTVSGVEFVRARDASEPILTFAVLSRGEERLALDDLDYFHAVERRGSRIYALAESTTEGPGPTLELLVSEDDGLTFEHRASVPKPNYQANFEEWTIDGDELTLVVSLADADQLSADWRWPWGEWRQKFPEPLVGPGRFVLRSKNAGRTWRLER